MPTISLWFSGFMVSALIAQPTPKEAETKPQSRKQTTQEGTAKDALPQEKASKEVAPKDLASLLESKNLPETTLHFEILADGKPVGHRLSRLSPTKGEDGAAYEYRAEAAHVTQDGLRVDDLTIAKLKRNFEPLMVARDRNLAHPKAPKRRIQDSAKLGESEVELSREDTFTPASTERSVAKPAGQYVYGIEFVFEAAELMKNPTLPVGDFDFMSGAVAVYRLTPGQTSGDKQEVVLQATDGGVGHRFTVGPDGRFETWADSRAPLVFKRCTEERFKEVKAEIDAK